VIRDGSAKLVGLVLRALGEARQDIKELANQLTEGLGFVTRRAEEAKASNAIPDAFGQRMAEGMLAMISVALQPIVVLSRQVEDHFRTGYVRIAPPETLARALGD
jgi:hypothetical protein